MAKLSHLVPLLKSRLHASLTAIDLSSRAVVDESLELLQSLLHSPDLVSRIKVVNFKGCSYVTDGLLIPFFAKARGVESCDLSLCEQITDQCLEAIAKHCKLLRILNLAQCDNITDMGSHHLSPPVPFPSPSPSCPHMLLLLHHPSFILLLTDWTICFVLYGLGFEAVAGGCRQLIDVNLEGSGCTKESVMALLALNSNVEALKFGSRPRAAMSSGSSSSGLNDSELAEIATNGANMKRVTFSPMF